VILLFSRQAVVPTLDSLPECHEGQKPPGLFAQNAGVYLRSELYARKWRRE
jgi:hypothetical protein